MPRAALTEGEIESFRERICQAAARLFAENGYEAVTLRAIAAELGCSPMTPYRYFANKEEIFRAVRLAGFEDFGRRIHEAAARHDVLQCFPVVAHAPVGAGELVERLRSQRAQFQALPRVLLTGVQDGEGLPEIVFGAAVYSADGTLLWEGNGSIGHNGQGPISCIADLDNAPGGGFAGAVTAALFLQAFVTETKAWAHLDVYGWNAEDRPGRPRGGEATALRALLTAIERRFSR